MPKHLQSRGGDDLPPGVNPPNQKSQTQHILDLLIADRRRRSAAGRNHRYFAAQYNFCIHALRKRGYKILESHGNAQRRAALLVPAGIIAAKVRWARQKLCAPWSCSSSRRAKQSRPSPSPANAFISGNGCAPKTTTQRPGEGQMDELKTWLKRTPMAGATTSYSVADQNLTGYAQVLDELQGSVVSRTYSSDSGTQSLLALA